MSELTELEVLRLLRERVNQAGSMLALAQGNRSVVGAISRALRGDTPPTAPKILELLGLEIVIRPKRDACVSDGDD